MDVRERAGLLPGTDVEFIIDGKRVVIIKKGHSLRGRRIVDSLRGKGTVKMTTKQIMALTRGES
jgi:bifunctional DNA-binding transcriptional regulator/antitoxin component of YhaV-PrlF toxin-antitoxin module